MALTDKQAAFVREYVKDFNATQAAIRAGYSPNSARQTGAENLSKPAIAEHIEKLASEARTDAIASAQEVLEALTGIVRGQGTRETSTKAGIVPLQPSWSESLRALDLLGKYHSLFVDRVEHTGADGGPIRTVSADDLTDDDLARIASQSSTRTPQTPQSTD